MDKTLEVEQKETSDVDEDKAVRCKQCEHEISSRSLAKQPYEHTFRNPQGYSWHIRCYRDAPGASEVGSPTSEHTWFPGCNWSYALCRQCKTHIGWWFSGADNFVGLIATRVTC